MTNTCTVSLKRHDGARSAKGTEEGIGAVAVASPNGRFDTYRRDWPGRATHAHHHGAQ